MSTTNRLGSRETAAGIPSPARAGLPCDSCGAATERQTVVEFEGTTRGAASVRGRCCELCIKRFVMRGTPGVTQSDRAKFTERVVAYRSRVPLSGTPPARASASADLRRADAAIAALRRPPVSPGRRPAAR